MAEENRKSQIDKFRDAARELQTDDDPERFAERVRKLAKPKLKPKVSTNENGDGSPSVNSVWDEAEKANDGIVSAIG